MYVGIALGDKLEDFVSSFNFRVSQHTVSVPRSHLQKWKQRFEEEGCQPTGSSRGAPPPLMDSTDDLGASLLQRARQETATQPTAVYQEALPATTPTIPVLSATTGRPLTRAKMAGRSADAVTVVTPRGLPRQDHAAFSARTFSAASRLPGNVATMGNPAAWFTSNYEYGVGASAGSSSGTTSSGQRSQVGNGVVTVPVPVLLPASNDGGVVTEARVYRVAASQGMLSRQQRPPARGTGQAQPDKAHTTTNGPQSHSRTQPRQSKPGPGGHVHAITETIPPWRVHSEHQVPPERALRLSQSPGRQSSRCSHCAAARGQTSGDQQPRVVHSERTSCLSKLHPMWL